MQTKNLILIGSVVVLGAVIFFLSAGPTPEPPVQMTPEEDTQPTESQNMEMNAQSAPQEETNMSSSEIEWLTDYEVALQEAKTEDKLVVIDFFATWCGPCKTMEKTTFADKRVRNRMKDFVPLKIDVDRQTKIAQQYGIQAMPTTAVVKPSGEPVAGAMGLLQVDAFLSLLAQAEAKYSK